MVDNQLEAWRDRRFSAMTPFDRLFADLNDLLGTGMLESPAWSTRTERPLACDLRETGDAYLVSFDIPGVDKTDIDIDVTGNTLTIRGERKEERKEGEGRSRFSERRYGSFQRSFTLPTDVNAERVEASYDNGVLCVAIPKSPEAKRRKIEVKEGGGLFSKILPGQKKKAIDIITS